MRYSLIILIIYAVNVYSDENSLTMGDYSRGFELITVQQAAIYKLSLPEEVYNYVTKKDLSDIRVFNKNHEPVPHIIRRSKDNVATNIGSLELPYFPLPIDDAQQFGDVLDITVSSAGKVIHIQSEDGESELSQNTVKHYLIDASHLNKPIDSIDFQLSGNETGFAKVIKLEYSDDLNQWLTLVDKATLTGLAYGNYILKNTHVDLPDKKIKYLRFTWLDDANGLMIDSIKANFRNHYLSDEKYWSTARLINQDSQEAIYEFDTGGIFNVEQVNIELPEDNTLIDVIIESRLDNDSDWKRRFSGLFYKLYVQDTDVTGGPVKVSSGTDRFWRIKLQSTDGIGEAVPVLKYAWRSNELYFLARGQGPYILAYGNANVTHATKPTSRLMNVIEHNLNNEMLGEAHIGREIVFKGDAALFKRQELPWQRIILWMILVIGVIVIGIMVFRLIKQFESQS